jgi:hypothetical protein
MEFLIGDLAEDLKTGLAQCGKEGVQRILEWIQAGNFVLTNGDVFSAIPPAAPSPTRHYLWPMVIALPEEERMRFDEHLGMERPNQKSTTNFLEATWNRLRGEESDFDANPGDYVEALRQLSTPGVKQACEELLKEL